MELHIKIGKLLQMERTRKEIALSDLATDLKITEANLQAVEDGDVSRVPSELYFKLFAKAYAEELGIDYEATAEAIQQDLDDLPAAEESAPSTEDAGSPPDPAGDQPPTASGGVRTGGNGQQLKKLAYIMGVVLAAFVVVVVINQLFFKEGETTEDSHLQSGAAMEPETVVNPDTDVSSSYNWDVPEYSQPEPMSLVLVARTESWASVTADGDTAIYRTLTPGRRYEVTARYRLRVSVGVPSAVTIELNGKPVNLRNPESGRIAGIEIDQVNLRAMLERPLTQSRTAAPPSQAPPISPTPEGAASTVADTVDKGPEAVEPSQADNGTPEDTSNGR